MRRCAETNRDWPLVLRALVGVGMLIEAISKFQPLAGKLFHLLTIVVEALAMALGLNDIVAILSVALLWAALKA